MYYQLRLVLAFLLKIFENQGPTIRIIDVPNDVGESSAKSFGCLIFIFGLTVICFLLFEVRVLTANECRRTTVT